MGTAVSFAYLMQAAFREAGAYCFVARDGLEMLRNSGQYMLAQWLDAETRSVAAGVVEERRMQFESRTWAAMYDVDIRDRGRKLVADLAAVDQLLANLTSGAVAPPYAQVGQLRARLDGIWLNGLPELHREYICLLSPRYYIDAHVYSSN